MPKSKKPRKPGATASGNGLAAAPPKHPVPGGTAPKPARPGNIRPPALPRRTGG